MNKELIKKFNELDNKEIHSIENFYRDFKEKNFYQNHEEIKKIYFQPERIKIPGYKNKQNFELIKTFGDSSLYYLNEKEIFLTGKILENNKSLRNSILQIYENNLSDNNNNNDSYIVNKENNIINTESKTARENNNDNNENYLRNFNENLLNKYNFLFLVNNENAVLFYEKIFGINNNINSINIDNNTESNSKLPLSLSRENSNSSTGKKESFLRSNSKKILTEEEREKMNLLSFKLIKIFEENDKYNYEDYNNEINELIDVNENNNSDNSENINNESYEIIEKKNNNILYENNSLNEEKVQYLYDSNNIKLKLSCDNEKNFDKFNKLNNFNSNELNLNNYFSNNYNSNKNLNLNFTPQKNNESFSQENLYGKELFSENSENNEIFNNNFSFEQTIEELRSYINLVGISLLE